MHFIKIKKQSATASHTQEKVDMKRREVLFGSFKVLGLIAAGKLVSACSNGVSINMTDDFTKLNTKPVVLKAFESGTYDGVTIKIKDIISPGPDKPEALALYKITSGANIGESGIRAGEEKLVYSEQNGVIAKIKCYEINVRSEYDRDIKFDIYKPNY